MGHRGKEYLPSQRSCGTSDLFAEVRAIPGKLDAVHLSGTALLDRSYGSISSVQRSGVHIAPRQSSGTAGKNKVPATALHPGELFGGEKADNGTAADTSIAGRYFQRNTETIR